MKSFGKFITEEEYSGFHGTPDARDIRKNGFKTLKQRYGHDDPHSVYWATDSHTVAKTYADPHRAFDYQNSEPAVLRVKLTMKNPKHIHWGGNKFHYQDKETGEWHHIDKHIAAAREAGHDGVVIHNIIDNYHADHKKPSKVMAVFHHSNIKLE